MKKQRATYNIDWLSLFCEVKPEYIPTWKKRISENADRWGNHKEYEIKETKDFNFGYKNSKAVWWRNYQVAIISWEPRSEKRKQNRGAIKICNAVLYTADWYFYLHDILDTLHWLPLNITRCDLCVDFNFFLDGLAPETFIRKYITKANASYVRFGSNKYALYGKKDMYKCNYDSIRWGSRQNGVSVYMYNKSKELTEVKNKPWIRQAWKDASLSSTKDVWRVEISITSQGLGLRKMFDNTIHTLFTDDIKDKDAVERMFKCYASKFFRFAKTEKDIKRKRDLKEVQLLNTEEAAPYKPITLYENHDTGRMEKIVANKLEDMYEWLGNKDFDEKRKHLEAIKDTINLFERHHFQKERIREKEIEIEAIGESVGMSIYSIHTKAEVMKRIGLARERVEIMMQKLKERATEILAEQQICTL